jgi:hypothetical protein
MAERIIYTIRILFTIQMSPYLVDTRCLLVNLVSTHAIEYSEDPVDCLVLTRQTVGWRMSRADDQTVGGSAGELLGN